MKRSSNTFIAISRKAQVQKRRETKANQKQRMHPLRSHSVQTQRGTNCCDESLFLLSQCTINALPECYWHNTFDQSALFSRCRPAAFVKQRDRGDEVDAATAYFMARKYGQDGRSTCTGKPVHVLRHPLIRTSCSTGSPALRGNRLPPKCNQPCLSENPLPPEKGTHPLMFG